MNALYGKGEIHSSNSIWSPALQTANKSTITPLIYDDNYIPFILNYCKENKISAIIPLFDIDLPILAKNKKIFNKEGIEVIVSNFKVTQVCNDKYQSYKFLKKCNIVTPKTFLSKKKVLNAIKNNLLSFPLILKPRWGTGSICIYQANSKEELEIFYYKISKEIQNTYLKYESKLDKEKSIIIQEKIIGKEYGLDVINDLDKNYVATLVKKKIAMRSGETDHAITEDNPLMRDLGNFISKNLRHISILDVDVIWTEDGIPVVLEMNCRFGGHYPFSHLAGANIPLAIVKWLKKEQTTKNLFEIKYDVEAIKDINPILLNRN